MNQDSQPPMLSRQINTRLLLPLGSTGHSHVPTRVEREEVSHAQEATGGPEMFMGQKRENSDEEMLVFWYKP